MIAVGVGLRASATAGPLRELIVAALAGVGRTVDDVGCLATVDTRGNHAALVAVADGWGRPIQGFAAADLAAVPVPHPSALVRTVTGTASVAEAAALLAAGPGARLLVPKRSGPALTVAVAAGGGTSGGVRTG